MHLDLPAPLIALLSTIALIHLCFAYGVLRRGLDYKHQLGKPTHLVPLTIWVLAALLGGVFVGCMFWIIHYSNINREWR